MTERTRYAFRLQASTMEEFNEVVAGKLSALRTADYVKERATRADMSAFWEILEKVGAEELREGD